MKEMFGILAQQCTLAKVFGHSCKIQSSLNMHFKERDYRMWPDMDLKVQRVFSFIVVCIRKSMRGFCSNCKYEYHDV